MKKKSLVALSVIVAWAGLAALGASPELVNRAFTEVNANLSFGSLEWARNNRITRVFSSSVQAQPETSTLRSAEQISARLLSPGTAAYEESAIPDYVLYESVFRMVVKFDEHAKSQEAKGEAVTEFRNYFKNEANLTSQEDELLTRTANNHDQDIRIIDAQAETLIEQLRMQHPIGSIPENRLIQPTPELLQLQEQRNELALHHKEQLRGLLGEDRFIEFDNFVQGRFASGFRAMPVSSVSDGRDQGGAR